jgi:signal transduction histidine kinase
MLFIIPLVWLALRFSQRSTHIAVAVVAAGISALIEFREGRALPVATVPGWYDMLISIDVFLLIGCGGALLISFMTFRQHMLLAALAREHAQLRQYAQALDSAEEAARRMTAADLHDGVGQVLAGQSMTLAAMRAHAHHPKLASLIEEAVEASHEAQEGLRLMIQDLSPPELEHATLEEILRWLGELFRTRFGFSIEYRIAGGGSFGRNSLQLVYRCTREMLMNACKHSGRKNAWVEVKVADRRMTVTVRDDGVGFDPLTAPSASTGRFGLAQLRERVRAAGGTFHLATAVGAGCRAMVQLPI